MKSSLFLGFIIFTHGLFSNHLTEPEHTKETASFKLAALHQSKATLDQYLKSIDTSEIPFLIKQIETFYREQPFQGLKIYHCTPIDLIIGIKISALYLGGADVVVSKSRFANPKQEQKGIELIKSLGIEYRPTQLVYPGEIFDIYMDCGGELIDKPSPRLGYTELTRTGEVLYERNVLSAPLISVNSSMLKKTETTLGTADGCLRALEQFFKDEYREGSYLLFGYGNVGSGIAQYLSEFNIEITIIDINPEAIAKARSAGFQAHLLSESTKCKNAIANADFIITATGEENMISDAFSDSIDLFKNKILINMGFSDEYGSLFSKEAIANEKKSFNFALDYPTKWKYLDPVFYAHNQSVMLLQNPKLLNQVYQFPKDWDREICSEWERIENNS